MIFRRALCTILLIVVCFLGPLMTIRADVAPPSYPPGASIGPSVPTQVRMVSEAVTIAIQPLSGVSPVFAPRADPYRVESWMNAAVEATFVLRNLGTKAESFVVRFPLGDPDDAEENRLIIRDFAAWVDGQRATTTQEPARDPTFMFRSLVPDFVDPAKATAWYDHVPWATWPVSFPVGKDVRIRVTYTQFPRGYRPTGNFSYILQTGAGWKDTIGEGTVSFKLPYPVTFENAAVLSWQQGYQIQGDQISWHFKDLEPTLFNNLVVCTVEPVRWTAVLAARQAVAAAPAAAIARFQLGIALNRVRQGKKDDCGGSWQGADVQMAYQMGLAYAPADRHDVYDKYARWLLGIEYVTDVFGKEKVTFDDLDTPDRLLSIAAKDFQPWPGDPFFALIQRLMKSPDFQTYVEANTLD